MTDAQWLDLAADMARVWAQCTRRQVGAVLVQNERMVSYGFNASYDRKLSCLEGQCPRGLSDVPGYDAPGVREGLVEPSSYDIGPGSCIALHAEQRCLVGTPMDAMVGSVLYVTHEPCAGCWRMIKWTPTPRVVWPSGEWSSK